MAGGPVADGYASVCIGRRRAAAPSQRGVARPWSRLAHTIASSISGGGDRNQRIRVFRLPRVGNTGTLLFLTLYATESAILRKDLINFGVGAGVNNMLKLLCIIMSLGYTIFQFLFKMHYARIDAIMLISRDLGKLPNIFSGACCYLTSYQLLFSVPDFC